MSSADLITEEVLGRNTYATWLSLLCAKFTLNPHKL